MTWGDVTSASTPSWSESTSDEVSWGAKSGASAIGNASRFVQAAPREDAQGGIDFFQVISDTNPWSVASAYPISISSLSRNDPA